MSEKVKGVAAMLVASSIWGLSPIYYKWLDAVPPLEVLSHRTLWSFVIFGLILLLRGRIGQLKQAFLAPRTLLVIAAAGLLISLNWFVFILSIQTGHAVEASLGYYVFPLVAVALGFLVFGEKMGPARLVSVVLAGLAVAVLGVGLGATPWVPLVLAGSFGLYGLIKKSLDVGPVVSVTGEVTLLLPLALVWIWGVNMDGWTGFSGRPGGFFGHDVTYTVLLALSGFMTAGPLMLFSYATRRLRLSTVGLIQYLNPTLQFSVAVLIFQEKFTIWHGVAFAMIWLALLIYTVSGLRPAKSAANAPLRAAGDVRTDI